MKRLFLDDLREPQDVFLYIRNNVYFEKWDIVRSYEDFKTYILENGIPDVISFDHDLADEHYNDILKNNDEIDYSNFKEKTGYECVKWLINYMIDNNLKKLPKYYIHTLNPIGRENMKKLLESFERFKNNENK